MSDNSQASDDPFYIPRDRTGELGFGDDLWVKLSEALRFLGRFKKVLEPQDPQEALMSALRSGLMTSQCEVRQRIKHAPDLTISSARDLTPVEWSEATHLNFWDDAINLRDGTPAKGIEISKYELYNWLSGRIHDDLDYLFSDFDDFIQENGGTLTASPEGQITAIKSLARENRGGRPITYDWPGAYLKVLVRDVYAEGRLTALSSQADVIALLRGAFLADGAEEGPQESILKDHARRILAELKAIDHA